MMRTRAVAMIATILAVGILTTVGVSSIASTRRQDRTEATTRAIAQELVDAAAGQLATALDSADRASGLNDLQWLTADDYNTFWGSLATTLPGNSTATLVVAVPPGELDEFVAAERIVTPSFELSAVNGNPPSTGHLISIRSATDRVPLGLDLSSIPGTGVFFWSLNPGDQTLADADVRSPGRTNTGQIQMFTRHEVKGPAGELRDAWTTVQIEARPIFVNLVDAIDSSQGFTVSTSINDDVGTFGVEQDSSISGSSASIAVHGVDIVVDAWSDGSTTAGLAPRMIRLIGFAGTALIALLGLLGLAIAALLQRLGQSDRDARSDQLTTLKNRRWLVEHFEQSEDQPTALLFCDIDRFKIVNDSADHSVGDELLVRVARRMEAELGDYCSVVRFGGDEFIVVSEPTADQDPAEHGEAIASRLQSSMRRPFTIAGEVVRVTLSIGIAGRTKTESLSGAELIRRADVAAGYCKQNGRNQHAVYDRALRQAERDSLAMESELQAALDDSDLVLHFQPIVDADGTTISFESLVRWNRQGTLVPPNRFLPVVAEIGRMVDLGAIVLEGAIAQLACWVDEGMHHPELSMHINVDPTQLTDSELPSLISRLLSEHDLAPHRLVLELTEGEWIDEASAGGHVLDRLADLGVGLAIDDFGSGYSSMARILDVEGLVEIKIDRSIVCRATEPRQQAFLLGLSEIADRLDVVLVAEGIETEAEHAAIAAVGINRFQGYLFGHPAPARSGRLHERSPLADLQVPDAAPIDLTQAL